MQKLLWMIIILVGISIAFPTITKAQEDAKKFITDYITALNAPDWQGKVKFAFPSEEDWNGFVEEHQKFRNSFKDYSFTIDFMTIEGNKGSIWGTLTAEFVQPFVKGELKNATAKNQKLVWKEAWYFEVKNGKFGGNFQLIYNEVERMKQLGLSCLPE